MPLGRMLRRTRASPEARNDSSARSRGNSTAPFISFQPYVTPPALRLRAERTKLWTNRLVCLVLCYILDVDLR
jgi:hypothetical protein